MPSSRGRWLCVDGRTPYASGINCGPPQTAPSGAPRTRHSHPRCPLSQRETRTMHTASRARGSVDNGVVDLGRCALCAPTVHAPRPSTSSPPSGASTLSTTYPSRRRSSPSTPSASAARDDSESHLSHFGIITARFIIDMSIYIPRSLIAHRGARTTPVEASACRTRTRTSTGRKTTRCDVTSSSSRIMCILWQLEFRSVRVLSAAELDESSTASEAKLHLPLQDVFRKPGRVRASFE